MIIRGKLTALAAGLVRLFSGSGRAGEEFSKREFLQHYGFASSPKPGAELIIVVEGNVITCIGSDDRRYRLDLSEGEVVLHDWQGQKVHLKSGKEIEISGCDTLVAIAAQSATVTAPEVTVVASTKITLQTPLVECTEDVAILGDLAVTGNIIGANVTALDQVADSAGSMTEMRTIYNEHTQPVSAGVAEPPNQVMS